MWQSEVYSGNITLSEKKVYPFCKRLRKNYEEYIKHFIKPSLPFFIRKSCMSKIFLTIDYANPENYTVDIHLTIIFIKIKN